MRFLFLGSLLLLLALELNASFSYKPVVISSKENKGALQKKVSFSRSKRSYINRVKQIVRQAEVEKTELALLLILAVLLPPLSVFLKEGRINSRFWISLLLTLLFWLPGVIYTILVILAPNQE